MKTVPLNYNLHLNDDADEEAVVQEMVAMIANRLSPDWEKLEKMGLQTFRLAGDDPEEVNAKP